MDRNPPGHGIYTKKAGKRPTPWGFKDDPPLKKYRKSHRRATNKVVVGMIKKADAVKEETLNELSPKTLASYVKKSALHGMAHAHMAAVTKDLAPKLKHITLGAKRLRGVNTATDKLANTELKPLRKKRTPAEVATASHIKDWNRRHPKRKIKEEVVAELKTTTLRSYHRKANMQLINTRLATHKGQGGMNMFDYAKKDPTPKEYEASPEAAKHKRIMKKRFNGMKSAETKMNKEDVQLAELKKSTYVSYLKKAGDREMAAHRGHAYTNAGSKQDAYWNKAVKRRKGMDKARSLVVKKPLSDPSHANWKKPYNEETIIELKKSTLKSYIKHAVDDKSDADYHAGNVTGKQSAQGFHDENEVNSASADRFKNASIDSALTRSSKRTKGINNAVKKLAKEEANLSELKLDTYKAYYHKVKKNPEAHAKGLSHAGMLATAKIMGTRNWGSKPAPKKINTLGVGKSVKEATTPAEHSYQLTKKRSARLKAEQDHYDTAIKDQADGRKKLDATGKAKARAVGGKTQKEAYISPKGPKTPHSPEIMAQVAKDMAKRKAAHDAMLKDVKKTVNSWSKKNKPEPIIDPHDLKDSFVAEGNVVNKAARNNHDIDVGKKAMQGTHMQTAANSGLLASIPSIKKAGRSVSKDRGYGPGLSKSYKKKRYYDTAAGRSYMRRSGGFIGSTRSKLTKEEVVAETSHELKTKAFVARFRRAMDVAKNIRDKGDSLIPVWNKHIDKGVKTKNHIRDRHGLSGLEKSREALIRSEEVVKETSMDTKATAYAHRILRAKEADDYGDKRGYEKNLTKALKTRKHMVKKHGQAGVDLANVKFKKYMGEGSARGIPTRLGLFAKRREDHLADIAGQEAIRGIKHDPKTDGRTYGRDHTTPYNKGPFTTASERNKFKKMTKEEVVVEYAKPGDGKKTCKTCGEKLDPTEKKRDSKTGKMFQGGNCQHCYAMKEDIELVTELSPNTLKSYVKKASEHHTNLNNLVKTQPKDRQIFGRWKSGKDKIDHNVVKMNKRAKGVDSALDKLNPSKVTTHPRTINPEAHQKWKGVNSAGKTKFSRVRAHAAKFAAESIAPVTTKTYYPRHEDNPRTVEVKRKGSVSSNRYEFAKRVKAAKIDPAMQSKPGSRYHTEDVNDEIKKLKSFKRPNRKSFSDTINAIAKRDKNYRYRRDVIKAVVNHRLGYKKLPKGKDPLIAKSKARKKKFGIKEQVVTELKKSTLQSYSDKAGKSLDRKMTFGSRVGLNKKRINDIGRRIKGIAVASNKLKTKDYTKEEFISEKVSKDEAKKVYEKLGYTFDFDQFHAGMNVELEHKDVTHGDLTTTAKIAAAHLKEKPDYYTQLAKVEKK
jgi:Protein of unknown function (DUF5661)